jgi:hypothetical protein
MGRPVVHFEIGGKDAAKLRSFYAALFDWKFNVMPDGYGVVDTQAAKGPFPSINGGIRQVDVSRGQDHYQTFYITVPDLAATLAQAQQLGGKTLVPVTEVPGMGAFAFFGDPEGNIIGIWRATEEHAREAAKKGVKKAAKKATTAKKKSKKR